MNYNDFFQAVKENRVQPVYLMEGPEEYIKGQAIARLCKTLLPEGLEPMNLSEMINPGADELIAVAETLPFMAERRVVIVRESEWLTSGKKADEANQEAVSAYLERQSPETCLLFVVKGKADGRKKLYLQLKKKNAVVDFSPMDDLEAAQWAVRSMRVMGKGMDLNTAHKLVFTVGRDAALLKQEMEKLAGYSGERQTITEEDIDEVCVRTLECTVFQLVDAQVTGRYQDACTLLNHVLEGGEDRFMVLSMLLRQYRLLYHMRRLMEERAPQGQIAGLLGIPPFAVSRMQGQARRYSVERLRAAYDYLYDLEFSLKSGQMPQEGSAEAALFHLNAILNASPEGGNGAEA